MEIAIGCAWLAGIAAAVRLLDLILGKNPLAAAVAGAILVDFATARAGVTWDARSDAPANRSASTSAPAPGSPGGGDTHHSFFIARRLGKGAAIGAWIAIVTVVLGVVLGWARISMGMPSPVLGFALVQAVAISVRDELLYRGIVLTVAERARLPGGIAGAYAALAGTAAIAWLPGSSPDAWVLSFASGWLFARLWQRGRSAWEAVGAHAAWIFCAGPLLRGGLIDVDWAHGALAPGARAEGMPAYLASAVCVVTVLGASRLRSVIARVRAR